ncbi:MAG: hypothetical protein KGL59_12305 [Acidobacteriota bacterium]|nr:hypothetical protein [Acidobacteriota bacterium]
MSKLRQAQTVSAGTEADPSLKRHAEQCGICRHPQRAQLEQGFLNWVSARDLATEYQVSKSAIYNHAEVTGLLDQRHHNTQSALDRLIERVDDAQVTAGSVISAIRLRLKMEAGRATR